MSFIQNFYTSRDNKTDGNTYVGQQDRLWYNPDTNSIYVNTANVPGGTPVSLATGADIVANDVALNSITSRTGTITITGDIFLTGSANIAGNISPAAPGKIGGIQPGPGVDVSNEGILTIDTANIPLSFGNFTASNNILSIVNVDEDMILSTQGNAEIQLIGNVGFYRPDGLPPDTANRYAFFNNDGQVAFYVPETDPTAGAVKIIGSASGNFSAPQNTGVMLQITGQNNDASRLYNDSIGGFAAFVGRRINGTVASPTAVQAGDEIIRISSTGYDGTQIPGSGTARIVFQAMENYTPTARGSNLSLWATAVSSNVLTKIATVDVANGVNATKFTTSGTVSAAGNVTGNNLIITNLVSTTTVTATGNVNGGNVVTDGRVVATGNISTSNYLLGNAAFTTGINAFGNVYANGVAILATSGSSSLTMTPGNNIVILGDNGTKAATISVKDAPTFTGNVTAGNVNSYVSLTAGTTTKAPLVFASGNITTIPTPGAMNYDGRIFYATPQGQERGLLKSVQTYILNSNYNLTDQTAVQSLFGVSANVSTNTRYVYVVNAVIYKTANNITLSYAIDGNATLARHTYQTTTTATSALATLSTPSVLKNILTTGFNTPVVVSASLNSTGYYSLQITGLINVTTGGTWNPLIAFSGLPGAGSYVAAGSSVELYSVGAGDATVNIGTWA